MGKNIAVLIEPVSSEVRRIIIPDRDEELDDPSYNSDDLIHIRIDKEIYHNHDRVEIAKLIPVEALDDVIASSFIPEQKSSEQIAFEEKYWDYWSRSKDRAAFRQQIDMGKTLDEAADIIGLNDPISDITILANP